MSDPTPNAIRPETGAELLMWQRYAGYLRSCAMSGERDPYSFETFTRRQYRQPNSPPPSAGSAEERLREALNIGLCLCGTARALAIHGGHRNSEIAVNATEEELRQRLAALAGK